MHEHHSFDYVELPAADLDRSRDFYRTAFGWRFNYEDQYASIIGSDGDEVGGLAAIPGSCPLVLLFSEDLDASLRAVEAAGGTVTTPPFDFPGGRRFHFTDPSGNELGVWAKAP
jgi:uncharacterized protein